MLCSGTNITVWSASVESREDQLHIPLEVAVNAFDYHESYTGVKQPLGKFDLVAVPGKGGAMENWGLLMFDEARLVFIHIGITTDVL